MKKGKLTNSL